MMKSKCPFGEKPIPHLPIISKVDSKLSKLWFQSCVKFCECSYIAQPVKVVYNFHNIFGGGAYYCPLFVESAQKDFDINFYKQGI